MLLQSLKDGIFALQTQFIINLNKECYLVTKRRLESYVKLDRIMIKVKDSARDEVMRMIAKESAGENAFIRVGVQGGGCSGLMYELNFDTEIREGDKEFEDNGVKIVVDMKSYLYLIGTELDYSGGLNGKGFSFVNPNANRTCGCGESFSI